MMKRTTITLILTCAAFLSLQAQETIKLSRDDCREMALSTNEDVLKADNSARQAALDRKIAGVSMLPQFQGSATGLYVLPDIDMMGMDLSMRGTYMAGISLIQPIYTGGKITAANRLARIGEDVAQQQIRLVRSDIIAGTDNAYWTLLAVRRKVRMLEAYRAQLDSLLKQTRTAVGAGMATDYDLMRVEASRSDLEYQYQRALGGEDLCRLSLCRLTGLPEDARIVLSDTAVTITPPEILKADISGRPEMIMLQKQVEAGKYNVDMARADFLPTVGLSLGYTYFGNIKVNGEFSLGEIPMLPIQLPPIEIDSKFQQGIGTALLAVKIPIFQWGKGSKTIRKARLELENSKLDLQKNTRLMNMELRQAEHNLTSGYMLISTAEENMRQAEEHLRVTRNKYEASMISMADLLDAQSQWQAAASNLIEAQTQYLVYRTQYLKAAGRLSD